MEQIKNTYITELYGYLKCISRLCANHYVFGATAYASDCEIDDLASNLVSQWGEGDEYIQPSEYKYLGCEAIDSDELFKEIESYIFNGLLDRGNMPNDNARKYATKMFTEDINEYYGLVSTTQNKKGEFHPLLKGGVYRLNIKSAKYEKSFYFIKKIENIYVLTYFLQKTVLKI